LKHLTCLKAKEEIIQNGEFFEQLIEC